MSVVINGIKMPPNCDACPMLYEYRFCALTDDHASSIEWKTEDKRMPNCPLIEIPDHGDLIDRDETAHEMWVKECYECNRVYDNNGCKGCAVTRMINVIACAETAPAVIPAERSEASICDNCDERSGVGCSWCKRMERSEDEAD